MLMSSPTHPKTLHVCSILHRDNTDLGPFLAQQADNIGVSCGSSQAQGCHPAVSRPINRCPHFKQQSYHLCMAQVGVHSQNGGVPNHLCAPGDASTTQDQQATYLQREKDECYIYM